MDVDKGQILDAADKSRIHEETIVIFTGDDSPEFFKLWDGWVGPWRG
jgi:hypothetical protein